MVTAAPLAGFTAPESVVTSMAGFAGSGSVVTWVAGFAAAGAGRPEPPGERGTIPAALKYPAAVSRRTPIARSIPRSD